MLNPNLPKHFDKLQDDMEVASVIAKELTFHFFEMEERTENPRLKALYKAAAKKSNESHLAFMVASRYAAWWSSKTPYGEIYCNQRRFPELVVDNSRSEADIKKGAKEAPKQN